MRISQLYRHIYYAYDVALDANLADLRPRLLAGAFEARHPERIYVPKASGVHRPLALLGDVPNAVGFEFGIISMETDVFVWELLHRQF